MPQDPAGTPPLGDTIVTLEAMVAFLRSTPLFDALDAAERAEIVRIMEVERLTEGERVFHEGQAGDSWYVVLDGAARVLKDTPQGSWRIRTAGRGDCFGEMAILDGERRSATVEAAGPLTVLRFRRATFEELLDQGSLGAYKLVLAIARMLSRRHRQLTHQICELVETSGAAEPAVQFQASE